MGKPNLLKCFGPRPKAKVRGRGELITYLKNRVSLKWMKSNEQREKEEEYDTPGTMVGLGGHNQILAIRTHRKTPLGDRNY